MWNHPDISDFLEGFQQCSACLHHVWLHGTCTSCWVRGTGVADVFFYLWENTLKMISELLQGLIREVLVCIGYKGKTALTRNQTENNKTGSFHSQLLEGLSNLSKAFLFLSRHWFYKVSLWRDTLHLHFPLLPFTLVWKPLQSLITSLQQNKQNLWTCLTPECH